MAGNLVVTTGAADNIPITQADFLVVAEDAIDNARDALNELSRNQYVRAYYPSVGDKPDYDISYTTPTGRPSWSFNQNIPDWSNIPLNLGTITKVDVDDFTGVPPAEISPNIPTAPSPTPVPDPGLAPVVDAVLIPDPPALSVIADPKEWAIILPLAPIIDIPDFTVIPPSIEGITPPTDSFSWSETAYNSDLLTNTVALVERFNQGGVVIEPVIWEALWARDNDRENRAAEKLIAEINEEWSSRGFQLPQGVQNANIAEVRQNVQSTAASRSRDIAIKEADMNIENLKFAVNQGIALENMRGGWYQQALTRQLDAIKFSYTLSVEIYNAEISFYNAQLTAYQAEAMVYKTQIEAEVTKLEAYKIEMDGQKIIGELNTQQVQIYKIRVEALQTEIQLYNAELQSIKIGVEIDATRIDAYSKEVQAYGERIKAVALEYEAYRTAMEGAKIESEIYSTNVNAYASRVQAYSVKIDAEAKNTGIDIETNKMLLQEYDAKLKAYTTQVSAATEELKAEVAVFDAKVKTYAIDVANEKEITATAISTLNTEIQAMAQDTQTNISGAELDTQASIAEAELSVEAMKQVAATESALAGSAMSAVSISQSMSDSAGNTASV